MNFFKLCEQIFYWVTRTQYLDLRILDFIPRKRSMKEFSWISIEIKSIQNISKWKKIGMSYNIFNLHLRRFFNILISEFFTCTKRKINILLQIPSNCLSSLQCIRCTKSLLLMAAYCLLLSCLVFDFAELTAYSWD